MVPSWLTPTLGTEFTFHCGEVAISGRLEYEQILSHIVYYIYPILTKVVMEIIEKDRGAILEKPP